MLEHERNRSETLEVGTAFDVRAVVGDKWWLLVTGGVGRSTRVLGVNRKHFEVCLFTRLLWDLKAEDVCIKGSLEFADYREQLVSDAEFDTLLPAFCEEVGLPTNPDLFVTQIKTKLEQAAKTASAFESVTFENGLPRLEPRPQYSPPSPFFLFPI